MSSHLPTAASAVPRDMVVLLLLCTNQFPKRNTMRLNTNSRKEFSQCKNANMVPNRMGQTQGRSRLLRFLSFARDVKKLGERDHDNENRHVCTAVKSHFQQFGLGAGSHWILNKLFE